MRGYRKPTEILQPENAGLRLAARRFRYDLAEAFSIHDAGQLTCEMRAHKPAATKGAEGHE